MTRFVTYDAEVASRLSQAVGVQRVELREPKVHHRNPALIDAIHARRAAALIPASDEQVLLIHLTDSLAVEDSSADKKQKKTRKQSESDLEEIGTQPSGFLGLQDEPLFSHREEDEEDPPRSLWKKDE